MPEQSKASIINYYYLVFSGDAPRYQDKVMAWIIKNCNDEIITRHVIADRMGIAIQTVCGAVGRLIDGKYLKQDDGVIPDPITTNPSHRLHPVLKMFPPPVQKELPWPQE